MVEHSRMSSTALGLSPDSVESHRAVLHGSSGSWGWNHQNLQSCSDSVSLGASSFDCWRQTDWREVSVCPDVVLRSMTEWHYGGCGVRSESLEACRVLIWAGSNEIRVQHSKPASTYVQVQTSFFWCAILRAGQIPEVSVKGFTLLSVTVDRLNLLQLFFDCIILVKKLNDAPSNWKLKASKRCLFSACGKLKE